MSEEDDDKQYDATPQKLRKAREKGDIPRSTEINVALAYLGLFGVVAGVGTHAANAWIKMAARAFGAAPWPESPPGWIADLGLAMAGYAAGAVLIGIVASALLVLLGLLVQRAIIFTPKKLAPDLSRINPLKSAKQKFGKSGLVSFGISLMRAVLIVVGGWLLYRNLITLLLRENFMEETQWIAAMVLILKKTIILALFIAILFAGVDMLWKHLEFRKRQRMSRKEMTDEHKESEGDPHSKAARRQKGVEIVMSRMIADVEKADVVILNPTHYAVALEWKRGSGRAPVCLAKGVDDVARRIREKAAECAIPTWTDPPCARALHATVDIGAEIKPEHFAAVAAAIRFAEAMRKKAREGWRLGPATKDKRK